MDFLGLLLLLSSPPPPSSSVEFGMEARTLPTDGSGASRRVRASSDSAFEANWCFDARRANESSITFVSHFIT
jgi:hypothetical protein